MIEVSNLTKKINNKTIVDNISFSVNPGETFVILGTSGCGKTTTLKMINRLIEPTSGVIKINGKNVKDEKPEILRRHIGYVIQNIGLFPHWTIAQNISIVPLLLGWDKSEISKRVHALLELVDLPPKDFIKCYPHELSGGQKQRVGIARALAADPPLVLLDEPFGALDTITRRQIRREFINLESLIHKTIVLVTHDVMEAFELADKICIMNKGKIEQIGTQKDLFFKPKNQFVRDFLEDDRKKLETILR